MTIGRIGIQAIFGALASSSVGIILRAHVAWNYTVPLTGDIWDNLEEAKEETEDEEKLNGE